MISDFYIILSRDKAYLKNGMKSKKKKIERGEYGKWEWIDPQKKKIFSKHSFERILNNSSFHIEQKDENCEC